MGGFFKVDGRWVAITNAYLKENGKWVAITDSELIVRLSGKNKIMTRWV